MRRAAGLMVRSLRAPWPGEAIVDPDLRKRSHAMRPGLDLAVTAIEDLRQLEHLSVRTATLTVARQMQNYIASSWMEYDDCSDESSRLGIGTPTRPVPQPGVPVGLGQETPLYRQLYRAYYHRQQKPQI